MTCRHQPGDPNCSSNQPQYIERKDPDEFEILKWIDHQNSHCRVPEGLLVLQVKYPTHSKWAGTIVLVFEGVASAASCLRWQKIDPTFQAKGRGGHRRQAPVPLATFPSTDAGWDDAILFAKSRSPVPTPTQKEGPFGLLGE
jgi:hypothetical protein